MSKGREDQLRCSGDKRDRVEEGGLRKVQRRRAEGKLEERSVEWE
jgi:hypothetical protein